MDDMIVEDNRGSKNVQHVFKKKFIFFLTPNFEGGLRGLGAYPDPTWRMGECGLGSEWG